MPEPALPSAFPWTVRPDGILLSVRLTPKSARDGFDGIEELADGRRVAKARVRALPEAGAANAALVRLTAKTLDVPLRAVSLESGATSRVKILRIDGDPARLESRIAALFGAG